MKKIKKIVIWLVSIVFMLYLGVCSWFYFSQGQALFNTSVKLNHDHVFKFSAPFEERYITMQDSKRLHGVLFKAKESKGLILWLPGGRGILDSIGLNAKVYTDMNYDVFVLNYRGFGKSEGKISSEKQFNQDMQTVYSEFKKEYPENKIVIFGYSLGTGPAAVLAANNKPKMLILEAPYYSMVEMTQKAIPYLPISLLLKYKFNTSEYLEKIKSPIVIIHGEADKKIPVEVSYRLKKYLKPTDKLLILEGQGHNDFEKNKEYLLKLSNILN